MRLVYVHILETVRIRQATTKTNRINRIVVPLGVFFNNIKSIETKGIKPNRTQNNNPRAKPTTIINTHIVAVIARPGDYTHKVAKWLIKAHAECLPTQHIEKNADTNEY